MEDDTADDHEAGAGDQGPLAATMAAVLDAFRQAQGFSDDELAAWLGMAAAALPALAAARRPNPSDADYHAHCADLAARIGCDAFALRTLLRWYFGQG